MALVLKDRVRETSTSTGTGTITLDGAVTGFQSFSAIGSGNTTFYTITMAGDWEVGIGTYTSPNQLSRDTVLESSNSNALVPFGAGTKDVFATFPAEGFDRPPAIGGTTPNTITSNGITVKNTTIPLNDGWGVIECVDDGIGDNYNDLNIYVIDQYSTKYAPFFNAGISSANFVIRSQDWTTNYQYITLQVPSGMSTFYTMTLPSTAGSNNQVLKTDGSGNLSWLDFGSPPAIGGTTPNTITGTTITATDLVGGSPPSFVINDGANSGVNCTFGIDQTTLSPYITATDGATNYPLQLNNGVTFPSGVNFYPGRTNAVVLENSGGVGISVKAPTTPTGAYNFILPTSAGSNNQVLKTDGSGNLSWTDKFVLGAGTATAGTAPLKLTSGTNLTTAEAGAMEYNGTTVFITGTAASGRGVNLAPMMVRVNTDRAKATNNTTLEAVFDAANDTLALAANTLYYFKGVYIITKSASATAAGVQIGFAFSNAQQEIGYKSIGFTTATGTAQTTIYNTVATAITATATATGATDYVIEFEGWFKSNATTGGTLIPQFTQSVAGSTVAPTAKANSWFMIQPMSSTPTTTLIAGNWS